jgi:hypothetical protein
METDSLPNLYTVSKQEAGRVDVLGFAKKLVEVVLNVVIICLGAGPSHTLCQDDPVIAALLGISMIEKFPGCTTRR